MTNWISVMFAASTFVSCSADLYFWAPQHFEAMSDLLLYNQYHKTDEKCQVYNARSHVFPYYDYYVYTGGQMSILSLECVRTWQKLKKDASQMLNCRLFL